MPKKKTSKKKSEIEELKERITRLEKKLTLKTFYEKYINYFENINQENNDLYKDILNINDLKIDYSSYAIKSLPKINNPLFDNKNPLSNTSQEDLYKDLFKKFPQKTNKEILSPLERIILDDKLMDDIIINLSIPELLSKRKPEHPGVILYGPPGTGKTEILEATVQVYKNAGAYAKVIKFSELLDMYMGNTEKSLEKEIKDALSNAEITRKPSLIAFDEGDNLLTKTKSYSSADKAYVEIVNILKRYVGSKEGKNLVLLFTTNELNTNIQEALIREGRMTDLYIGFPNRKESKRLFQYFFKEYKVFKLSDTQAYELVDSCNGFELSGAFVELFARSYIDTRKYELLKDKGYETILEALNNNVELKNEDVLSNVTYDSIKKSLDKIITEKKNKKLNTDDNNKNIYC